MGLTTQAPGAAAGLWAYLGIAPVAAAAVVLATVVLYLVFVGVTRLLGQRFLASLSSFDLLVVIALGAVIGRATLGHTPTLAGGLLAILTLLALEGVLGQLRRRPRWERAITSRAVLLMAGSVVLDDELRRCHVTEGELRSRLRESGIRSPAEVAAVVLEPTGRMSVLRRGAPVDPAMLRDVRGAERLPPDLRGH